MKKVFIIPLRQRTVQEGVYYSDKLKHIVFDIAIINNQNKLKYLEYNDMVKLFKEVNFLYTPILSIDSLQKLHDYSLDFNSAIPSLFG